MMMATVTDGYSQFWSSCDGFKCLIWHVTRQHSPAKQQQLMQHVVTMTTVA
eukprot:SAG11_NODE_38413_length_252_cov_1.006536_1_plen_50_part_10